MYKKGEDYWVLTIEVRWDGALRKGPKHLRAISTIPAVSTSNNDKGTEAAKAQQHILHKAHKVLAFGNFSHSKVVKTEISTHHMLVGVVFPLMVLRMTVVSLCMDERVVSVSILQKAADSLCAHMFMG